jgi:hypothetical protein
MDSRILYEDRRLSSRESFLEESKEEEEKSGDHKIKKANIFSF